MTGELLKSEGICHDKPDDTTLDTEEEAPAEPVKCQPWETQNQESNFFQRLCFGGNFFS